MNAILKSTIAAVPERTIRTVCGSIAIGTAALILLGVSLFHPSLASAVAYGLGPFAIAVTAWAVLGAIRLWLVGFLPPDANVEKIIPSRLQPWIRGWLLIRFGFQGSGLLILLVGVVLGFGMVVGLAHREMLGVVIRAFVFLAWGQISLDVLFAAAFNAWLVASRE